MPDYSNTSIVKIILWKMLFVIAKLFSPRLIPLQRMLVRIGCGGGGGGNRTRVLKGVSKSVYMLISMFIFSLLSDSNERDSEEVSLFCLTLLPQARPVRNKSLIGQRSKASLLNVVRYTSQARHTDVPA